MEDKELRQIKAELTRIKTSTADLTFDFDEINNDIININNNINKIETSITEINDTKLPQIISEVNSLQTKTSELSEAVSNAVAETNRLSSIVSGLNDTISLLDTEVQGLKSSVNSIIEDITSLKNSVDTINTSITDITSKVTQNRKDIDYLLDAEGIINNDISTLSNRATLYWHTFQISNSMGLFDGKLRIILARKSPLSGAEIVALLNSDDYKNSDIPLFDGSVIANSSRYPARAISFSGIDAGKIRVYYNTAWNTSASSVVLDSWYYSSFTSQVIPINEVTR